MLEQEIGKKCFGGKEDFGFSENIDKTAPVATEEKLVFRITGENNQLWTKLSTYVQRRIREAAGHAKDDDPHPVRGDGNIRRKKIHEKRNPA